MNLNEYYAYLSAQKENQIRNAEMLKKTDRTDEANLAKVRANIYDVCETVCKVHMKRPEGGTNAYKGQLDKFRVLWSAERERATQHGNTEKAAIEDIKLETLEDAACKFGEVEP